MVVTSFFFLVIFKPEKIVFCVFSTNLGRSEKGILHVVVIARSWFCCNHDQALGCDGREILFGKSKRSTIRRCSCVSISEHACVWSDLSVKKNTTETLVGRRRLQIGTSRRSSIKIVVSATCGALLKTCARDRRFKKNSKKLFRFLPEGPE